MRICSGIGIALLALIGPIACSAPVEESVVEIELMKWQLASLDGKAAKADAQAPTLAFEREAKRVSGFGGCNRYFAEYTLEGDVLKLGPIGATKKMCAGPAMDMEASFLAALSDSNTISANGQSLELRATDGSVLMFESVK